MKTYQYNDKTTTNLDDDELTNEDNVLDVLDVTINPPLRLTIFETPRFLSESGKNVVVAAMNEHATYRLNLTRCWLHKQQEKQNYERISKGTLIKVSRF